MKRLPSLLLVIGLLFITILAVQRYWTLRNQFAAKKDPSRNLLLVSVPRGQQKKIDLPDGSTVWLNAASLLTYPRDMDEGDRIVELHGEAFFMVADQPHRPFRVKARDIEVEVLGTQFNVRNYPEELISQAVVKDGAIKVMHGDEQVVLHSKDAVEVNPSRLKGPALTVRSEVDAGSATNWKEGFINFNGVDLTTLLHDLSRAYNVDIRLEGDLPGASFYGSFRREWPVEQVLRYLNWHGRAVQISRVSPQTLSVRIPSQ